MDLVDRTGTSLILLLLSFTAACNDSSPATSTEVPEWFAEVDLRVGSIDDPDYSLTYFRSMAVGRDGTMYTLHPQEQLVRVFGREGDLAGLIGGRGGGPGEFENAAAIGWVADTLWVLDFQGYRFSYFSPAGEFLGSFSVPFVMTGGLQTIQPPRASGLLFDGTVHGSPPAFSSQIADGTLTHLLPMLMTRKGEVTDTLPSIPFGRNSWAISDPDNPRRGGSYSRQPWGDGPLWSYAPNDRALLVLDRVVMDQASEPTFRISKLSFGGDTLWSRTFPFAPIPLSRAEVDSVLDARASALSDRGFMSVTHAEARSWASASLFAPSYRPGAEAMLLGRDGGIWVSEGPRSPGTASWLILDAQGNAQGRVELPLDFTLLVADAENVWGVTTDEFDVPYLLRLRITRSD